ncbi:MAG: divalent-cation tolerance protein CutA [Rickettsiales bacterium]
MMVLLYSPFPSLEAARLASHAMLQTGAVACCNLITATESHFVWQGEPTHAKEVILIAKTIAESEALARQVLAANHPYECPAILSFPALANPAFMAWAAAAIGSGKKPDKGD